MANIRPVVESRVPFPELPGADAQQARNALALQILSRLKQRGLLADNSVDTDSPLPQHLGAALQTARAALGLPPAPVPETWGQAFVALTTDLDGDQRSDLDLGALLASGLLAGGVDAAKLRSALQGPGPSQAAISRNLPATGSSTFSGRDAALAAATKVWTEDTLNLSEPSSVTPSTHWGSVAAPVRYLLLEDGSIERFRDRVPAGATLLDQARLTTTGGSSPELTLSLREPSGARIDAQVFGSGRTDNARVPRELAYQVIDDLFRAAPPPAGDPLHTYRSHLEAQRSLIARPTRPSEPELGVIWQAGRVRGSDVKRTSERIESELGVRPKRWFGWVDDVRETEVAKVVLDVAERYPGISPAYLYTSAIGEGLLFYLEQNTRWDGVEVGQPVSGFQHLGTDTFGSKVEALRAEGLIPADFVEGRDYTLTSAVNELGQEVKPADFPDLKRGLTAMAAMLSSERTRFLRDARQILGPAAAARMTPEAIRFFTNVYYNAGPAFGRRQLRTQGLGYFRKWTTPDPGHNRNARFNALNRLASLRLVEELEIFPEPLQGIVLARGARGAAVRKMQRGLAGLGYPSGPADGIFGRGTERALRQFQSAHGLSADGVAGPRTLQALNAAIA